MSVGLLIEYPDREESDYFPVATEEGFRDYRIPIAKTLKLIWMPHFQAGMIVREMEDIRDVLEEFRAIKSYIASHRADFSDGQFEHFTIRLDGVIERLSAVKGYIGIEVFIG